MIELADNVDPRFGLGIRPLLMLQWQLGERHYERYSTANQGRVRLFELFPDLDRKCAAGWQFHRVKCVEKVGKLLIRLTKYLDLDDEIMGHFR
jgi:hypothetical protein